MILLVILGILTSIEGTTIPHLFSETKSTSVGTSKYLLILKYNLIYGPSFEEANILITSSSG